MIFSNIHCGNLHAAFCGTLSLNTTSEKNMMNHSRKNYALCVLLLFAAIPLFAQDVDLLTGRAIINMPIGGISALDLSVGVNLSHHGGSLRVSEGPGNAGMGWNISGGGYVVREVRGLPDDYNGTTKKGWLYNSNASNTQSFNTSSDDNLADCTDETSNYNYLNTLNYNNDTEPDVFYFNAPGLSGKFVLGADGQPKLIPYQDLQITFGSTITIKNNMGITYTFGQTESLERTAKLYDNNTASDVTAFKTNYNFYSSAISFTHRWNLSSIQSSVTGATATFSYQTGDEAQSANYVTLIQPNAPSQPTTQVDTLYYLLDKIHSPKELTSVTLGSYTLAFEWANSLINSVTISESETGDSRKFLFEYASVQGNTSGIMPLDKPFLFEVKQVQNCVPLPSYSFMYTGVSIVTESGVETKVASIPWFTGQAQDFFGYYNGNNSNKNIPTVYFYEAESGARRLRVTPIPSGATLTQQLNGTSASANLMLPNAAYVGFGALSRITYPTGGLTVIAYEPNKYWDASTSEELAGPGVRVASITTSGGEVAYGNPTVSSNGWHAIKRTIQYTRAADSFSSGLLTYPPVMAFTDGVKVLRTTSDLGSGASVLYARVKESVTNKGWTIYQYEGPNAYPDATSAATISKVTRSSTLVQAANETCSAGLLKNGPYTFPFAPNQDLEFTRGFPSRVSAYDQSGTLTQEKRMSYATVTNPGSGTLKGLKYEAVPDDNVGYDFFVCSTYSIPYNQSRRLVTEIVKQVSETAASDSTKVASDYMYNNRNMLTHSTQTTADGAISENFVKYALDYDVTTPAVGDMQANAIKQLNTNNQSGVVIETYSKFTPVGGSEKVTGGQVNLFKLYGTQVLPYQSKGFPQGLPFTSSFVTTGSNQTFASDADYIGGPVMEYANNLPANQIQQGILYSGTHFSTGTALPIASFANCKAEHAVYEGFEMANTRGLVLSGTPVSYAAGRTGNRSMAITSASQLNTINPVTKSGNQYRISFWAYGTGNATITVQANPGTGPTATAYYTAPNQWKYFEQTLDVTTLGSTFTLRLTSSAAVQIDDFVAMPQAARVSFSTMLPLTGSTSQTDDLGNSTVINYDALGRKSTVLDHQRNLVEVMEYKYQKQGEIKLNAQFNRPGEVNAGEVTPFTAVGSCLPVTITYAWTFTDDMGTVSTATGATVNKTFSRFGMHTVRLTVTAAGYAPQFYQEQICVNLGSYTASVAVTLGGTTIYSCDPNDDRIRLFTASLANIHSSYSLTYHWEYTDINGNWLYDPLNTTLIISNTGSQLKLNSPNYTYQVRCTITSDPKNLGNPICSNTIVSQTAYAGITFVNQGQCQ
jgi:hypothetical protein